MISTLCLPVFKSLRLASKTSPVIVSSVPDCLQNPSAASDGQFALRSSQALPVFEPSS